MFTVTFTEEWLVLRDPFCLFSSEGQTESQAPNKVAHWKALFKKSAKASIKNQCIWTMAEGPEEFLKTHFNIIHLKLLTWLKWFLFATSIGG